MHADCMPPSKLGRLAPRTGVTPAWFPNMWMQQNESSCNYNKAL